MIGLDMRLTHSRHTGLDHFPITGHNGLCLSGQESAPATSTGLRPALFKPRPRASLPQKTSRARILPPLCLGDWVGREAGRRGRKSFRLSGAARLRRKLRRRDGQKAGSLNRMVDISGANQLVESQLMNYLRKIEVVHNADCLTYIGPIAFGADDFIRDAVEKLRGNRKTKSKKLLFILETQGGFAEAARRISDTLRHHYQVIDFLVPSNAMSAGTILAMSGDAIFMDYYSVLGPIDPQVPSQDGKRLVPALGYLIRYEELLDKANLGEASAGELEILLEFDQGELYSYEQARDLSVSLLEEWLVKYKFKNWKQTEKRKLTVTRTIKKKRAREVAEKLNDAKKWNSHGIGISMSILRRDLKLRIDDFGKNDELNKIVREYHRLLTDYMGKMRQYSMVQTRESYEPLMRG